LYNNIIMKYPKFLEKNDTIGICAPSAGVGKKVEDFQKSIDRLHQEGFNTIETPSVRFNNQRSNTPEIRGEEVNQLFRDNDVNFVMCAAGGDFLDECLPYIDFNLLKEHPKYIMGASDPTGILYPYTTMCDVATIYGLNGGSYSEDEPFINKNLEMIQGINLEEKSYKYYMSKPSFMVDKIAYDFPTNYQSNQESINVQGRCIGGCIDVLKDLIGTKFDHTLDFINKYQDDGIIWYFDNFSLSSEVFYRTLLQFKFAGYFEHTKAIIIGRTLLPSSDTDMTYLEATQLALGNIPFIFDADVGHTLPHMTMINGAILNLHYEDNQMNLEFILK